LDAPGDNDLRRRLNIPDSAVVLLTVAQSYKYATETSPSFAQLAGQALASLPDAHLIAVGSSPETDQWTGLEAAFPERVHLLGTVLDLNPVIASGDIYLDSFPFASITSVLEATMAGIPALCFQDGTHSPLQFDDYTLHPRLASTADAWVSAIEEWCDDAEARRAAGARMQLETLQGHFGPSWDNQLEALYRDVRTGTATCPTETNGIVQPYDVDTFRLHSRGGLTRDARALLQVHGFVGSDA